VGHGVKTHYTGPKLVAQSSFSMSKSSDKKNKNLNVVEFKFDI
jgi:hypothetical protein